MITDEEIQLRELDAAQDMTQLRRRIEEDVPVVEAADVVRRVVAGCSAVHVRHRDAVPVVQHHDV